MPVVLIRRYRHEDLRRSRFPTGLRSKEAKKEVARLDSTNVNVFEILYWYRIRANYKDLDIIEENLLPNIYQNYVKCFYEFLLNYVTALKSLIAQQVLQRKLAPIFESSTPQGSDDSGLPF